MMVDNFVIFLVNEFLGINIYLVDEYGLIIKV